MKLTEEMIEWNKKEKELRKKNKDSDKVNPFQDSSLSMKLISE